MYEQTATIAGELPGPTSVILGGVHGNEKCGVEAIQNILPTLVIERGTVILAFGNPRALEQNVRYTESNLNRMFAPDSLLSQQDLASYEYTRAQELRKLLDRTDVLLDIHASFTPNSEPFIICEPNANDIVPYLPTTKVVYGFDAVEPGGTDYYMNKIGKVGICLECGYLGDPQSTAVATRGIESFLVAQGHVHGNNTEETQDRMTVYTIYITKTAVFSLTKDWSDFEFIPQGTVIGTDGETPVIAEKDSRILFATNHTESGKEAFLLAASE